MIDVICDLDGVIYRGDQAIDGAPMALARLVNTGARVVYVTNNSTLPPDAVAARIQAITGVTTEPGQVITSSMAAASMLSFRDSPALVVGEVGVREALQVEGVSITSDPGLARSVVVGMDRHLTYDRIARAADAVRAGARFVATNTDPTFPTPHGLLPGAGSVVAAIAEASGRRPEVAGKPHQAVANLVEKMVGPSAWVVGDRVDTDVALASDRPGWVSVLVLSGVTGRDADTGGADHVVEDFAAAVDLLIQVQSGP